MLCGDGAVQLQKGLMEKALQVECDGQLAEWCSVFNYDEWVACEVSCVPPIAVLASGSEPCVGLVIGTAIPLLHRCAMLGFQDVGVPYLNMLLKAVPPHTIKTRPVTVIEKVFALILWLLPDFKDWNFVCKSREHTPAGKAMVGNFSTLADEVMDSSDKVELRKEHQKHEDKALLLWCVLSIV